MNEPASERMATKGYPPWELNPKTESDVSSPPPKPASVAIATKANGDIMMVVNDAGRLKDYLRKLGHHPHHDHTDSMIWYDFQDNFICYIRTYDVAEL